MSQTNDKQTPLTAPEKLCLERFLKQVRETNTVWGLCDSEDWVVCPSVEYQDSLVYPFWSDPAAAKRHCIDEWAAYSAEAIDLDSFIYDWLRGMNEDDVLAGLDWDAELSGLEIEPLDLAGRLLEGKRPG